MIMHHLRDTSDDRRASTGVVSGSEVVRGYHHGAICIRGGGSVTIDGTHSAVALRAAG